MINMTLAERVRALPTDQVAPWCYGYLYEAVSAFMRSTYTTNELADLNDELFVAYLNRVAPIASGNIHPPAVSEEAPGLA